MGGTIITCDESTCAYWIAGRCKAERVSMLFDPGDIGEQGLTCDTYENRELAMDVFGEELDTDVGPFKDDDFPDDDWWVDGDGAS